MFSLAARSCRLSAYSGPFVVDPVMVCIALVALAAYPVPDLGASAEASDNDQFVAMMSDKPIGALQQPNQASASQYSAGGQGQGIIGWISGVSAGDGVISGWAADTQNADETLTISFYSDAPPTQGGTLMGATMANAVDYSVTYMRGLSGHHGFIFPIPDEFKNGKTTTFFAQATNHSRPLSRLLSGPIHTFKLTPIAQTTAVTDSSCLSPQSRCPSTAFDFGPPHFPSATGRDDGKNYFDAWGCTSPVGLNHIVRLNILPNGGKNGTRFHDENFQKDSLLVNAVDQMFGSPIIYFTSSRYNSYSTVYSLKKAAYGPSGNWQIFDVLDYPSNSGGFSSLDGRYPAFIMNDYSQPGWGPTSPFPGSNNYVPGVANVAVNPEHNSFALVGTGVNGLTTIVNTLQGPGVTDGGVHGRTCIHMNPKLFDYKEGVPQSLTAFLFQEAMTGKALPCVLPDGSTLPGVGYYVYRYQRAIGWQLEKTFGPIESNPDPDQAIKLLSNQNNRIFIAGNWDGQVTTIDLDDSPPRTKSVILSCNVSTNGSKAKFGEATGDISHVWFLGIPPGAATTYGNNVFTGDIYYAYVGRISHSRHAQDRFQ